MVSLIRERGVRGEQSSESIGMLTTLALFLLVVTPFLYAHDIKGYARSWLSVLCIGFLSISVSILVLRRGLTLQRNAVWVLLSCAGFISFAILSAFRGGLGLAEFIGLSLDTLPVGAVGILCVASGVGFLLGSTGTPARKVCFILVLSSAAVASTIMIAYLFPLEWLRFIWAQREVDALFFGPLAVLAFLFVRIGRSPLIQFISWCSWVTLVGVTTLSHPPLVSACIGVSLVIVELALSLRRYHTGEGIKVNWKWFSLSLSLGVLLVILSFFNLGETPSHSLALQEGTVHPALGPSYAALLVEYSSDPWTMFLGRGPASYPDTWVRYRPIEISRSILWAVDVRRPHDSMILIASSFGLPAVLTIFVALTLLIVWFFHLAIRTRSRDSVYVAVGGVSVGFFLLISSFLYPLDFPHVVLSLFLLGFFLGSIRQGAARRSRTTWIGRMVGVSGVGVGLSCVTVCFFFLNAHRGYVLGLDALREANGKYTKAEELLSQSLSWAGDEEVALALAQMYEVDISSRIPAQGIKDLSRQQLSEVVSLVQNELYASNLVHELNPESVEAYLALGNAEFLNAIVHNSRDAHTRALTNYKAARIRAPEYPLTYFLSGRAYAAIGDPVQSKSDFEKALSLKPDYAAAKELLGQLSL